MEIPGQTKINQQIYENERDIKDISVIETYSEYNKNNDSFRFQFLGHSGAIELADDLNKFEEIFWI